MPQTTDQQSLSTFHLRRRTPGSFLLVPCPRLGRSIRCQGQLEAAAAVILAGCPLVLSLQEQPLSIWYAWRETASGFQIQLLDEPSAKRRETGCSFSYIVPDFLVQMQDGLKRLIEVKPSHRLDRPLVRRKLAVGRTYAFRQGWNFHVLTEKQLLEGPLLSNLRLLARYRSARIDSRSCDDLLNWITDSPVRLVELTDQIETGSRETIRSTLFHLIAAGRLDCDLQAAPLNDQTLLFPGGTRPWDPFDSVWAPSGCSMDGPTGSSASSPPISLSPTT